MQFIDIDKLNSNIYTLILSYIEIIFIIVVKYY